MVVVAVAAGHGHGGQGGAQLSGRDAGREEHLAVAAEPQVAEVDLHRDEKFVMGARDDGIVDAHRAVEQRLGAGAVRREEREQERMEQFRRFHIFGLQNVYTRFTAAFVGPT